MEQRLAIQLMGADRRLAFRRRKPRRTHANADIAVPRPAVAREVDSGRARGAAAVEFEPQAAVEVGPYGAVILFTSWVFRSSAKSGYNE